MAKNTKLELTWIGKDKRPRLEPRVLVEDTTKSYHASVRHGADDIFDNMLIHGDNLLALKALEQKFAGQVKCIYIDPPYNTGSAFEHYDDGLEHSIWLGLMRERLCLLRTLLAPDGVILVQIDKNEAAYLKVLMDEVFMRDSYVTTIAVRMSATSGFKIEHSDKTIVKNTEYIHVYSWNLRLSPAYEVSEYDSHYSLIRQDEGGVHKLQKLTSISEVENELCKYGLRATDKNLEKLFACSEWFRSFVRMNKERIGRVHTAPAAALQCKENLIAQLPTTDSVVSFTSSKGDHYWIKRNATSIDQYIPISLKYQYTDTVNGYREELSNILGDWWDGFYYDMGNVEDEGGVRFKASKKPERLLFRILNMFTEKGDLVLDSFLGSGTTAAVAHKMGRRWIGIELGDHCYTHCLPRLKGVVDGTDQSGISKFVNWQGGGGYRFYELAPTLIKEDAFGQKVINKEYRPEMLAEAVCKLEGFVYAPSTTEYFIHGHSAERDFIYVTTNTLTPEHLVALNDRVGDERTLLVCCKAFTKGNAKLPRLTVKKIPKAVLDKCEYGHDDYSLNVKNLPMAAKPLKQGELAL